MRYSGPEPRGTLILTLEMGAICDEGFLFLLDGEISSSWSPNIAPMPDLPKEDRVYWIPAENPAFNNFFLYLCGG